MKYIEQLLKGNKPINLWLYLPFPLFFVGLMFMNWIGTKMLNQSSTEMIRTNIELYGKNINFLMTVGPMVFMLLMLMAWVLGVQKQSFISLTTARSKIDLKRIGVSFGIWSACIIGLFVYQYVSMPENFEFNFKFFPFLGFLVLAILLIPLQVAFEEYFLRGYLMQAIGLASKSRFVALVITSLLFGLLHSANPEVEKLGYSIMIYYIGAGFLLGIMTLMDEGIELALGFHIANNLIGALLVTSNWTAFQTNSIFLDLTPAEEGSSTMDLLIQVGVFFPLLLLVLARLYKWNNWKAKLFGKVLTPKD